VQRDAKADSDKSGTFKAWRWRRDLGHASAASYNNIMVRMSVWGAGGGLPGCTMKANTNARLDWLLGRKGGTPQHRATTHDVWCGACMATLNSPSRECEMCCARCGDPGARLYELWPRCTLQPACGSKRRWSAIKLAAVSLVLYSTLFLLFLCFINRACMGVYNMSQTYLSSRYS
jgi:hypothetical protein